MASRAHPPRLPVRRRVTAGLRTHWRGLAGILLLGIGTPITIAGGWASKDDRLWWLLAAAACAAGAGVLQLDFGRSPQPEPVSPIGTDAKSAVDGKIRTWNIPPPVRTFTGRDSQLAALRHQLIAGEVVALVPAAALHGMGGIGKTQLARAYAHRYADQYQIGWWVVAESELAIVTSLSELAILLGLPSQLPPPQLVDRLRHVLAARDGWLLVFDNAEQPAMVEPFLPGAGGGHVLLTSRNPAWHGIADPIPVDLLPLKSATWLLQQRTGDPDHQAAEVLAEELGRLPLALEQAAAYIGAQHLSLGRYLDLYLLRHAALLTRGVPVGYPDTVDATFSLALDRLRESHPAAVQLLELCALLGPDQLPVRLLLSDPQWLPDRLASVARDPLQMEETVGELYRASLLIPDLHDTARIHRLVQVVTRYHLTPASDHDNRLDQAVQLLAALFPHDGWELNRWPHCDLLLQHAQAVLGHSDQQQHVTPAVAVLLTRVATYLRARGLHGQAKGLDEKALVIRRQLYAGDHPAIAESLTNLSSDVSHTGKVATACELSEQGLAMRQRLYGGDSPELAMSLHLHASHSRELGQIEQRRELYEQARQLHEEALAMRRRLYAGDHSELAMSLQLLGIDLRELGEVNQARQLHEEALAMRRRLYAGDHPAIAGSLQHLGNDLRQLGEVDQARELHEQALAMYQRLFGNDVEEVDVVWNLIALAADLRELGEAHQAREFDEQALASLRRLYDGDHRALVDCLNGLAADLHQLGEPRRAQRLKREAAAIRARLAARV